MKRLPIALLLALFAASGFAGLAYQSIWAHYLGLTLGHAAYAQAAVLCTYMGGMALGAWWPAGGPGRAPCSRMPGWSWRSAGSYWCSMGHSWACKGGWTPRCWRSFQADGVIGWGSGLTTHTLLGSTAVKRVDTVGIEPTMHEASRLFGTRVVRAYEDPRSHVVFECDAAALDTTLPALSRQVMVESRFAVADQRRLRVPRLRGFSTCARSFSPASRAWAWLTHCSGKAPSAAGLEASAPSALS